MGAPHYWLLPQRLIPHWIIADGRRDWSVCGTYIWRTARLICFTLGPRKSNVEFGVILRHMFNITRLWINRQPALSGGNNWNDTWLSSSRSCVLSGLWINRCSALCAASGSVDRVQQPLFTCCSSIIGGHLDLEKKNATSITTAHLKRDRFTMGTALP